MYSPFFAKDKQAMAVEAKLMFQSIACFIYVRYAREGSSHRCGFLQDDDLFSGILLERASSYFGKANMRRKMAFHYVLGGHRMSKAGLKRLSMDCYRQALPLYQNRGWNFAEVRFP